MRHFYRPSLLHCLATLLFVLCCDVIVTPASAADDVMTNVYARLNGSIKLNCPINRTRGSHVTWNDLVHNTDRDPHLIFTTVNNPSRSIASTSTADSTKYSVDDKFSLTINWISEDDTGSYFCQRDFTDDGHDRQTRIAYYITTYTVPRCEGVASLLEGHSTNLSCSATFVGNIDSTHLRWIRQSARAGVPPTDVTSHDLFDIKLARRDVTLTSVTYLDDAAVYTCRLTFGDVNDQCSVKLNVSHGVRDVVISPNKSVYHAGDEIRCSASGNPTPSISLNPTSGRQKSGPGWMSVIVPEEWIGTSGQLQCKASNTVAGKPFTDSTAINFSTIKMATTTVTVIEDKPARSQTAMMSSGPIVAGIVIGLVILAAIIVSVVCIRICKDRKQMKEPH